MTNPTRKEIIDAHAALEDLKNVALNAAHFCSDTVLYTTWKKQILAALPPKPHPTMTEVEWDDEEHYLAEAEHPTWGKVIMLGTTPDSKKVTLLIKTGGVVYLPCEPSQDLTLTGRRYTLTEMQE